MVLEQADNASEARPITPMPEIQRHKGMLFDDFTREHPGWQWSEKRRKCLMFDDQGRVWVPMFDPEYGVGIAYPAEFTPEAEERFKAISRKARADVLAGRVTYLDELEDEDDD